MWHKCLGAFVEKEACDLGCKYGSWSSWKTFARYENDVKQTFLPNNDIPKSKAEYDEICAADATCAAKVAKIYNADGVSVFSQNVPPTFYQTL